MVFSTVLFLLIVICCVAGVVNALAVRRELHARREQEYHARVRAETVALYFDYEAYARDLFLDSFTFIDGHVFRR